MDKTTLFILVNATWWLCGVFFGMAIEEKLFEPMRRKRQAKKSEGCSPEPFPMQQIETPDGTKGFSEKRLLVVAGGNDKSKATRVVGGRRDVPAAIPGSEMLADGGEDSQG